jgi:hypothetical protein
MQITALYKKNGRVQMKKEFKVKALKEKVEILEVNGQSGCLDDCAPNMMWFGNATKSAPWYCAVNYIPSAYRSIWN